MAIPQNKSAQILTTEKELVKQYLELDGQGRPAFLYTASQFAKTGSPCLVTEMIYADSTSTVLLAKAEGVSTWDASWVPDAAFSTPDTDESKTQLILTNERELTKQYQLLDGQLRTLKIYEAPIFAVHGSPCKVTEFIYQNATSTQIKGKKEGYASWDVSWIPDSALTVTT